MEWRARPGAHAAGHIALKLNTELVKDLRLPDVIERITALGFEPVGSAPQEFGEFLKIN